MIWICGIQQKPKERKFGITIRQEVFFIDHGLIEKDGENKIGSIGRVVIKEEKKRKYVEIV